MRCCGTAAVILSALAMPSAALADTRAVADGADERAAPLDIASMGHGHDVKGRLVHRVTMRAPWRLRALRPGQGELSLLFNIGGSFERALVVSVRSGRLYAEMRGGRNHGRVLARVRARRPNNMTVRVSFPRALLGRRVTEYHWYASTLVYEGEHVRGGDAAPGRNAAPPETLAHSLRAQLAG